MKTYDEETRSSDFDYFVRNYQSLFKRYGHKFLAIKNQMVLGAFDSVTDAINELSGTYDLGTYIIQECTGDTSAYTANILNLWIRG